MTAPHSPECVRAWAAAAAAAPWEVAAAWSAAERAAEDCPHPEHREGA